MRDEVSLLRPQSAFESLESTFELGFQSQLPSGQRQPLTAAIGLPRKRFRRNAIAPNHLIIQYADL